MSDLAAALDDSEYGDEAPQIKSNDNKKRKTTSQVENSKKASFMPGSSNPGPKSAVAKKNLTAKKAPT